MARPGLRREARTFAIGAACGFVAGTFLVATIVWQFGNVIGSRSSSLSHPAQPPAVIDRWTDRGIDDADVAVLEAAEPADPPAPAATTGGPVLPPPSIEPTIGAPPSSPAGLAGRDLAIPVSGIAADELVRSFDDERSGRRTHQAIDILAPRNTPVTAVDDGTIARLFNSKAGGITIYQFDPTEQFCYYYAHLERYADSLREGDRVRKGQVIGYVGTTGNAPKDTPHLHFAIFRLTAAKRWWEGTPIDPYDVLR